MNMDDLKQNLRLLILTDYIRKEYEKAIGNETMDVHNLGVLPFFELLRREALTLHQDMKIRCFMWNNGYYTKTCKRKIDTND